MTEKKAKSPAAEVKASCGAPDQARPAYDYQYEPGSGGTNSAGEGENKAVPKPNNLASSLKL